MTRALDVWKMGTIKLGELENNNGTFVGSIATPTPTNLANYFYN